MRTIAEYLVFVLSWLGVMALIGIACVMVDRWGKKRNQSTDTPKEEEVSEQE